MTKRKSIGSDPLDWIGEQAGRPPADAPRGGEGADPEAAALTTAGSMVSVDGSATYTLERQLLLVDGILREGAPRPRANQTLWILLFLLVVLGTGFFLFQEARRQWNARVLTLEGTIDRIEKEKGQSVKVLEEVIGEKDVLLREKQGAISRIEALHDGLSEELKLARQEAQDLKSQNRELIDRVLKPHREGAAEGHPAARPPEPTSKDPPQVLKDSEK